MRKRISRYVVAAVVSATLPLSLLAPVTAAPAPTESDAAIGDMCGHVQNGAVRALISSPGGGTFTIESTQAEPGKLTCVWSALRTGAPDGATPNATLTLDLYHFASAARARAQLRGFGVTPQAPQLVHTDDADDEVIQISPDMTAARHGVEIAVVRVTVPAALSDRPDWKTQLEALTLAGSGAQVPALTQPPAATSEGQSGGDAGAWRPPPHPLPGGGAIVAPILHVLWELTRWSFELVPIAIIGSLLIGVLAHRLRRPVILWIIPVVVGYAFANLILGPGWLVPLIYRYGVQAQATITGTFPTNDIYNNQNVIGFHVLIRSASDPVTETKFRTDDFNVYPPRNDTRYPDVGDVFTVRYLTGHPDDFVIVRDDGSPWARRLRCEDLAAKADQADQKTSFAPENPAFRQAAQTAHAALQAVGCQADSISN